MITKRISIMKCTLLFLIIISLYRICWIIKRNQELLRLSELRERVSESAIFIYRTYIDHRGNSSMIRVLAFNECHNKSVLQVQIGDEWLDLKPKPMYGRCPEIFSPKCSLVAYFHETNVERNFSSEDIAIKNLNNTTEILPLTIAEPTGRNGTTACIAPMFWYTDWSKLIFFIEYWMKQGVVEIIFYVHSTTADVKKVLNFYEKTRRITIIPWSVVPSSDYFNPNDEIYRLGQVLAHNDCFLRSTTEFTTVVDIDEIINTPEKFVKKVGSLSFEHHVSVFTPPFMPKPFSFENVNYEGLREFRSKRDKTWPPKIIARTNAVDRMSIHYVVSFRNKEIQKTMKDAILFHIRYTVNSTLKMQTRKILRDQQSFQLNLTHSTRTIFPRGASFNETTQIALGRCTDNWRKSPSQCKAPATLCRKAVIEMEDWIEETKNVFYVL